MHHITVDLLREAYKALKRDAAPGIDEVTWSQYGEEQEEHLSSLHQRVQSGRYRATPSKRVWLPKPDGKQRPIGIAALEDKIVQQAVVWVLNQIYEEDFMGFSYGFRPGRSQHNALDALWVGITQRNPMGKPMAKEKGPWRSDYCALRRRYSHGVSASK